MRPGFTPKIYHYHSNAYVVNIIMIGNNTVYIDDWVRCLKQKCFGLPLKSDNYEKIIYYNINL